MSTTAACPELISVPCDDWCHGSAQLFAARAREERFYAELLETASEAFRDASTISAHHRWIKDVVDNLGELVECSNPFRYELLADRLRGELRSLHCQGHSLFIQEEEAVEGLAKVLTCYSHALKAVAVLERRRYLRDRVQAPAVCH
jgi:hypothetical protein